MTRITTNLGGAAPQGVEHAAGAPPSARDRFRDRYFDSAQQSDIDYTDPKYATPQPGPKQVHGRRAEPFADVPRTPVANMRVRSKPPAVYYDLDGKPIPEEWTVLPVSADILSAIKNGDVERDMDYKGDGPKPQPQPQDRRPPRRRQHTIQATPSMPGSPPAE